MDLFVAGCQGLGLALAVGALAGAVAGAAGLHGSSGVVLLAIALVTGAFLFGASLATEDHPAWPGWPVGAAAAALSFVVARDVCAGARARAGGSGAGVAGLIGLYALCLAGISLTPAAPAALLALVASGWLWLSRRRRASRKHAGLRSLR